MVVGGECTGQTGSLGPLRCRLREVWAREQGTLALLFVFYFPCRCRRAARRDENERWEQRNLDCSRLSLSSTAVPRRQQTEGKGNEGKGKKKDRGDVEPCKCLIAEFL